MPPAKNAQSSLDQGSRLCMVIGLIVLLVGNLIPVAGAKGTVLVFGEILAIIGIIGIIAAWIIKQNQPKRGRARR